MFAQKMETDANVILRQGQEAYFAEPPNFEAARDSFLKVTGMKPDWVEGHHWLASVYEALEKIPEAECSYLAAIVCDPNDSRPQIALGRLLLNDGRIDRAIVELERGVQLKPHYAEADARLFLAEAYEAAGNLAKARAEWTTITGMKGFYPSYDEPMEEAQRKLEATK